MGDSLVLRTARILSSVAAVSDQRQATARADQYGAIHTMPFGPEVAVDEGSYIQWRNPTALTGIVAHIVGAFDATKPAVLVRNADTPGAVGAKRLYLDYIRLTVTVAPASATALHAYGFIDGAATRYSSAGSTLTGHVANSDVADAVSDTCYVGAVVAAAATASVRPVMGPVVVRSVIAVVKDEFIFSFRGGGREGSVSDIAGTTAKRIVVPCSPVVLNPGWQFLLHFAMPSNAATAMENEVEVAAWKR